MSLRDWWDAIKGLWGSTPKYKKPPFVPPHASQPDGKPQPEWPKKDERR